MRSATTINSRLLKDKSLLFIGWILFGMAIGFIILSIIDFEEKIPYILPDGVYDNSFISAMSNVSNLVPQDETLILPLGDSHQAPMVQFFAKRDVKIARGSSTIFDYMTNHDYTYALFFQDNLSKLFNSHFKNLGNYTTQYTKVHLYKLK